MEKNNKTLQINNEFNSKSEEEKNNFLVKQQKQTDEANKNIVDIESKILDGNNRIKIELEKLKKNIENKINL